MPISKLPNLLDRSRNLTIPVLDPVLNPFLGIHILSLLSVHDSFGAVARRTLLLLLRRLLAYGICSSHQPCPIP